eukprot:gene30145-37311_t
MKLALRVSKGPRLRVKRLEKYAVTRLGCTERRRDCAIFSAGGDAVRNAEAHAMSPSRPFIQRPVATSLLMLAIVLAGLVGFKFLPLSALPQVDFPTIQVQTLYPGASPEVMGQTVTAPLERQFGQMSGLQRMSSTSAAGVSIITLQFGLGQTLDVAEQEVQAAINAGGSLLPTDLPAPPVYAKVNPADAPVLTLAITSDTMPLTEVQNIVNTRLALKISQVSGVGLVSLSGGQRPAVRIQADTQALASYGLGLDTLRTAITSSNANSAKGSFDGPTRSFTINANDQLRFFDKVIVRYDTSLQWVLRRQGLTLLVALGTLVLTVPTQDLTIDAESGPTQYRVSLEGADTATVTEWAGKLAAQMQQHEQLRNVVSDAGATGVAAQVTIDRDSASRLSITAAAVDDALYSAFGQRIVSTIFTETNQYRVILEAQPGTLTTVESLGNLHLKTGSGKPTPLSAVATITEKPAPLQITHVAQYPATTLGFDTAPGVSLGRSVEAVRAAAEEIKLPPSVTMTFLGAAGAYQASLSNQLWLILAAVICVYIVLGVLYESYIHPLTILSTLPSAGVGALLALMVSGQDLGVIGIIGIILLIGIVKKNAIMMIDFAIEAERDEGKSPQEAIHQAALLRFRPILMTTLAALFAAVPLMLGFGEGAELRRPLGLSIFGGLIVSQVLTLYTTPVIYLGFDRLAQRWRGRGGNTSKGGGQGADAGSPPPPVNLSEPFVRRPIATVLLTIGLALAGIGAFFVLPVSPLPQVDYPSISVSASLPGASP